MGEPDVVAEPAEAVGVLRRRAAVSAPGRTPPRRASRPGGCAAARRGARASAADSRIRSVGDRERRARRDARPAASSPATGRGAVERASCVRGEALVGGLHDGVRRQPALATAPRSIEPRVGWNRRPIRARRPRSWRRARRRRRAGTRSGGRSCVVQPDRASQPSPAAAAAPDDVLVEPGPDRVQLGQPARTASSSWASRGSPTGTGGGGC